MKNYRKIPALDSCARSLLFLLSFTIVVPLAPITARAASATWSANPGSGDWLNPSNWMPPTVPNGPDDIATFANSTQTAISVVSSSIPLDSIVFTPTASAYAITLDLDFPGLQPGGPGIVNNSSVTQTFVISSGYVQFINSASAGVNTAYLVSDFAQLNFYDTSSAGFASLTASDNGFISFFGPSTGGNGLFKISRAGVVLFETESTAGSGRFILSGDGPSLGYPGLAFLHTANAGNMTAIVRGSDGLPDHYAQAIIMEYTSSAGAATIILEPSVQGLGGQLSSAGILR